MSVLVFIGASEGKIKKSAKEAAFYAAQIASKTGGSVTGIVLGSAQKEDLESLGKVGVSKILHDANTAFDTFDSGAYTKAISKAVESTQAKFIILSFDSKGKEIGPRLSARLKAGIVSGATALPETEGAFSVKRTVFSGKGIAHYTIHTDKKIISINPNSIQVNESEAKASIENFDSGLNANDFKIKFVSLEKEGGDSVPLPEAELVVSAGRGLKGPENWGMIEELAKLLGAATACSRAVSDVDWRPHHEHVGQTGLTIRPNLYIAIGISGAIQHLAGVNSSKTIVVINIDPEAPFFKAADYGIVGDAFVVVPQLIEAVKNYKANN